MSRAIHKMRGLALGPIEILSSDLGNVSTGAATVTKTFSINVGSASHRTLIVMATMKYRNNFNSTFNSCTIDGEACTEIDSRGVGFILDLVDTIIDCAVYVKKLGSITGTVNLILGVTNDGAESWGMSSIIVTNMRSIVETDKAQGGGGDDPLVTSSTLDGVTDGIAVGVTNAFADTASHTWGDIMTERSDIKTGFNPQDHVHSAAYDLLPSGRAAEVETVISTSTDRVRVLQTATFR